MPRNGIESNGGGGGGSSGSGGSSGAYGGGSGSGSGSGGGDGCIYPDEVIVKKGVAFNVRYTGCIQVTTSMKSLDFPTRTQLARECINRVCEAAGLKSGGKRRIDKKIQQYISDRPCMQNAGTNVIINVSSRAFTLINIETGELIASHNMPRISFASGGDSDTQDFLAYIAKNEEEWRACYVLECIGSQSEDLIVTIGKAFMLRYNALSRNTDLLYENNEVENILKGKDYYNDLPNKLPPATEDDLQQAMQLQQQQQQQQKQENLQQQQFQHNNKQQAQQQIPQQQQQQQHQQQPRVAQLNLKKPRDRLSSNLIDLNSPPPDQTTNKMNLSNFDPMKDPTAYGTQMTPPVRDVFDIPAPFSLTAEVQRSQLVIEQWFHGAISRPIAENLLKHDGDFLVRESQGKHGQYVLTGLEGKTPKHLLLIDPQGVVRTKDRIFDSISHLINYHWTNSLPIISEDSELVLRNPVLRAKTPSATTSATMTVATAANMTAAGTSAAAACVGAASKA